MDPDAFDAVYGECVSWTMHRSDGNASAELVPNGAALPLRYESRAEWCDAAARCRLHECDAQVT